MGVIRPGRHTTATIENERPHHSRADMSPFVFPSALKPRSRAKAQRNHNLRVGGSSPSSGIRSSCKSAGSGACPRGGDTRITFERRLRLSAVDFASRPSRQSPRRSGDATSSTPAKGGTPTPWSPGCSAPRASRRTPSARRHMAAHRVGTQVSSSLAVATNMEQLPNRPPCSTQPPSSSARVRSPRTSCASRL
jgi:hypothetical protein